MGWTSTNYPKGLTVPQFFYGTTVTKTPEGWDEYTDNRWGGTQVTQVAASGLVDRTEFYAVIRFKVNPDAEWGEWFLAVYMVRWQRRDDWGHNFGYKDMEESMGPNIARCPLKVLKAAEALCEPLFDLETLPREKRDAYTVALAAKVSALEAGDRQGAWDMDKAMQELDPDHWRRSWRERCYARIEARGKVKVKAGDIIQFKDAVRFAPPYGEMDTFQVEYKGTQGNALLLRSPGRMYGGNFIIPRWKERVFEVIGHEETYMMRRRAELKKELQEKLERFRAEGYPQARIVRGYIEPGPRQEGAA